MNPNNTWYGGSSVDGASLLADRSMRRGLAGTMRPFAGISTYTAAGIKAGKAVHVATPATGDAQGIRPRGPSPI